MARVYEYVRRYFNGGELAAASAAVPQTDYAGGTPADLDAASESAEEEDDDEEETVKTRSEK